MFSDDLARLLQIDMTTIKILTTHHTQPGMQTVSHFTLPDFQDLQKSTQQQAAKVLEAKHDEFTNVLDHLISKVIGCVHSGGRVGGTGGEVRGNDESKYAWYNRGWL